MGEVKRGRGDGGEGLESISKVQDSAALPSTSKPQTNFVKEWRCIPLINCSCTSESAMHTSLSMKC